MTIWLRIGGKQRRIDIPDNASDTSTCLVDGRPTELDARMQSPGVLSLLIDCHQYRCLLDRDVEGELLLIGSQRIPFSIADPRSLAGQNGSASGADGPRAIRAPMPGRVVRVLAAVGDQVEEGQGLVVIEAMKMQNELKAPKPGRVSRLTAEVGATVAAGDALVVIE